MLSQEIFHKGVSLLSSTICWLLWCTRCVEWFLGSYTSNRSQFVPLCNKKSIEDEIICTVPQGSVFGLILFNLYINDIVNGWNTVKYVLFADDTNILLWCKTTNNIENIVNIELCKWLCCV